MPHAPVQKRHRSDKDVNDRLVRVLREGTFQTVTWEEVQVGDLVRVIHDQFFPADLILLSSSEPQGIWYGALR
jgi:phospholipid-transporting ATPase